MNMKLAICIGLILCIFSQEKAFSQDYKFGIRAGLNSSTFLGPTISNENESDQFGFNNGIHFGVTFAYHLTDNFGFRTEVGYNQIGSKRTYKSDDAIYVFRNQFEREPRLGKIERKFDINNSYIHVPFMVFAKPIKKLEIFGGFYTQFLVLPTVGGTIDFTAPDPLDGEERLRYSFIQSLEGNYYSDNARGATGRESLTVELLVDGDDAVLSSMPRIVGAYYELDENEKGGSAYNWFDAGLEAGFNFYINKSLYLGVTGMYGLIDISNDALDVDYYRLDANQKFQFKDDRDINLSFQLSLGFKF